MDKLGYRIRMLRKELNYTLRELGEELNMSFSILAMYERGERVPPLDKLLILADFFSVSADYLMGRINTRDHIINKRDIKNFYLDKVVKIPVIFNSENVKYDLKSDDFNINEDSYPEYRIANGDEFKGNTYFYYKVQDNSMKNSRILIGDLALVKRQEKIDSGNIALVYLIDKSILIRRIYFSKKGIILKPDNMKYEPMIVDKEEIKILGEVKKIEFKL